MAYLVLSHRRPERVEALADRIFELSPAGQVVVHHDATGGAPPWGGSPPARGHLVERTEVVWGDWSIVDVSLRLVRFALATLDAQWFVFLSGDDRPVVDLARWESTVRESGTDGVVASRPITERPRWFRRPSAPDINYVRYMYRWRPLPDASDRVGHAGLEGLRRLSRYLQPLFKIEYTDRRRRWFLGLPRRAGTLPGGWVLHGGPQWVAFGARAAAALVDAEPWVVEWFRHTWIPDQAFFQTVLGNHPELSMDNRPLTFLPRPKRPVDGGSWMVVRAGDLEDVWRSGCAFARKFDPDVDGGALDLVDARVDAERSPRSCAPQ